MNILVKIHATSMNPHDRKYYERIKRFYTRSLPIPPLALGHDLSGTIIEIGKGVKKFKRGDEVFAMSAKTGAFGEYISFDSRMAALKPSNLSHTEAATVPMAGLTALQAFKIAKLKTGDKVLIIGGSGGVGAFAIQIAKAKGAEVTAVCSTANIDFVKSLGADQVIDYKKEKFTDSGVEYEIIFDTIGGESIESCKAVLGKKGQFVNINPSGKSISEMITSRFTSLFSSNDRCSTTFLAMPVGNHLEEIKQLIESGDIKVVIDKTFTLDHIEESMQYSKLGRTKGKIAINVI